LLENLSRKTLGIFFAEIRHGNQTSESPYKDVRMAFCFGFTMFSFRSFKFNELMHRPLGRAWLVVYAPFSLAVARLHCIALL
jgi:hypothetical protein